MSTQTESSLFTPVQLGRYRLAHRVVMAPLTRLRADLPGDVPNDLMAEYYGQRASAGGLIIAEATPVSFTGRGYLGAPGIYTDEQVIGWRKVTNAVHARGGRIFLQLWHVGRQSHVDLTDGVAPVAPSAVTLDGLAKTANGWVPVSPARALELAEIPGIIEDYRRGAERALAAGFDGVELHGANGYLVDQFLQDGTNKRTDRYGGSVENRARFLLEATAALVSVWGGDRVGVRLAPSGRNAGMFDSDPHTTFGYAAEQLNRFGLAYLHIVEPRITGSQATEDSAPVAAAELRTKFHGKIIAAGGFEPAGAEEIVAAGDADFVAFGRHFIANPDLPYRLEHGLPLNAYDRTTFYEGGRHGYVDYPTYAEVKAGARKSA